MCQADISKAYALLTQVNQSNAVMQLAGPVYDFLPAVIPTGRDEYFQTDRSRNSFHFFLNFWLIFAKIKSRDTLFCMSNQFC